MRSLAIQSLSVRGFRNLTRVDLELGPRFNVIHGNNGQGKTNLLEAVYVLATSRSFRTTKLKDLVGAWSETASVRGRISEDGEEREQVVGLRPGTRIVRVNDKRPPTHAAYAVRTPVVAFHPGVVALAAGSGSERRRLLDRVALYRTPSSLSDADGYVKAVRTRQRVLETRGESAADLDEWEELVVRHGMALSDAREAAAAQLGPIAEAVFGRIGLPNLSLRTRYRRTAPSEHDGFRATLVKQRARDRARGSPGVGPHRDDLELELGGRPMRGIASQGQHRAVVLSLELAEIEVIERCRDVRPILLLDDVSSELDRDRTAALFSALRDVRRQVLLTTTRAELIDTGALFEADDRRDFSVVDGRIELG